MKNNKKIVNENLRCLLATTKHSIYKFAATIGANRSSVNNWVKNNGSIASEFIPAIAEFFNVSIEYLFQENNETFVPAQAKAHRQRSFQTCRQQFRRPKRGNR